MPLVGTICCLDGQPHDFDHCISHCRKGNCQHTVPLLSAMASNSEKRKDVGISSSVLGGCPRQYILGERNDYYEDPENYYARWMGSFGHYAVEMGGPYPGVIQEVRFRRTILVDGVEHEVTGQPDWYDDTYKRIEDSKFTTWPPSSLYPAHEEQVNVYAWLLEGNGYEVESAGINYYHAPRKDTRSRHTTFEVPLWTEEVVTKYLESKLRPFAKYYKDGNIAALKAPETFNFGASCPFQCPCNPGRCCQSKNPVEGP